MNGLIRSPNLRDPDGFYAALVTTHEGFSDEASGLLNARLVLILANHIGDPQVLQEALALARGAARDGRAAESGSGLPRAEPDGGANRAGHRGTGEAATGAEKVRSAAADTGPPIGRPETGEEP